MARVPHWIFSVNKLADTKEDMGARRLRREVGRFRERFQALSTILQDLQGQRTPNAVLHSVYAIIASTVGADAVWLIDTRGPTPRPMLRSGEVLTPTTMREIVQSIRADRSTSLSSGGRLYYVTPLHAGALRWGGLVVRVPTAQRVDAEAVRFLSLVASLIGGAAGLWQSQTTKNDDPGVAYRGWLSLSALPSRVVLLNGEAGTGKRSFAQRLHARYGAGGFGSVAIHQGEADSQIQAALKQPGLRTLYVHDAAQAPASALAELRSALEANGDFLLVLGTSQITTMLLPDRFFSRAAVVTIRLPALRERGDEVAALVQTGLSERGITARFSKAARQLLVDHPWPGNYPELKAFIGHAEQALRLTGEGQLSAQLTRRLLGDAPWFALPNLLDQVEAAALGEALRRLGGNRAAVARALGMTPRQVGYKCDKYGL